MNTENPMPAEFGRQRPEERKHRRLCLRTSFKAFAMAAMFLFFPAYAMSVILPATQGVVVDQVAPDNPGTAAGFREGDILLRWEHPVGSSTAPTGGEIGSVFDWIRLETEVFPLGQISLIGLRDDQSLRLELPGESSLLAVRPSLSIELLREYRVGRDLLKSTQPEEGAQLLNTLAGKVAAAGEHKLACWLLRRIGVEWTLRRDWEKAAAAYRAALLEADNPETRIAVLDPLGEALHGCRDATGAVGVFEQTLVLRRETWGEGMGTAKSLSNLGGLAWEQRDLDQAEKLLRDALSLQRQLAPASLPLANTLNSLGAVVFSRGEIGETRQLWEEALAIQERLKPNSLELAATVSNLAVLISDSGDLDTAERLIRRALEIRQLHDPDGLDLAVSFTNLGNVLHAQGQLGEAERFFQLAMEIEVKRAPGGLEVAGSLVNLGTVASDRGDLDRAEDYYQKALRIIEKTAPHSDEMASTLNNLCNVISRRGALDLAEDYCRRALSIWEQLRGKESLRVALVLNNLGTLAWERHDLPRATEYFQRSLDIKQKVTEPDSLTISFALANMGAVAGERGDLAAAENYYRRTLDIRQRRAPESLDVADVFGNLATIAWKRGEIDAALDLSRQALSIQEKLAPGSREEAETLQGLGSVLRKKGQNAEAEHYLFRAVEALENQIGRLGGSYQDEATFRIGHDFYYRELVGLLVERGQPEEAFHVLERYRARAFLQMIAERDLNFSGVPAELEGRRRRIEAAYDRTQQAIAELDPREQQAEIDVLLAELRGFRHQDEEVGVAIRKASPRLARLRYPIPLDLHAAQQALDPGTLMLSYSVGEESTLVFAVFSRGPVEVYRVPVGRAELERRVEFFRNLIVAPAPPSERRSDRTAEEVRVGRELFVLLMGPVLERIRRAEHLLIIPDGPLHRLPWGALVLDRKHGHRRPGRLWQYLIERAPLHVALSATVSAELRQLRKRARPELTLAAFGDPSYPQELDQAKAGHLGDPYVSAAAAYGVRLSPLPGSRAEVTGIAALFPKSSRVYMGSQATEEQARVLPRRIRFLHFAAHGILNERSPLDSAVALTIPSPFEEGKDNGLLQAWEIFERLRLEVDVVVLSACGSGLGGEMGGEGLIGLTRAFQYAGAQSVVASLWAVSDPSTTELMIRFYRHLKHGRTIDKALRAAQLDLIRHHHLKRGGDGETEVPSPFVWAAFQLYGDGW